MKKEEQYIISESQELSIGQSKWTGKFFSAFPALKHRNYQLYFWGQLVSLIGTWLQVVAQGWLVLQLTHSAFWVGFIAGIGALPILIFSLFGGVIVDRFNKRNILIFTQISFMILAFILGFLTIFQLINIVEISILAFFWGIVMALDSPARQAFVVEMVGKKDLSSAIALNSGIFNAARVIGPGFAGILIALIGTGGAFIVNATSYIAVILALLFIRVKEVLSLSHPHPLRAIKEGLLYSFSNRLIRTLLIYVGGTSIFGWSYTTMMPVIAQDVFHQGASLLGYLYVAIGAGAFFGVFLVSAFSTKIDATVFILGGNLLFVISVILFSFTSSLTIALPLLFLSGMGLISQFAMSNSIIQYVSRDNIRGRVMSIYTLMFLGMQPLGSFEVGIMAENFGALVAIRLGAVVLLLFAVFVYLNREIFQTV